MKNINLPVLKTATIEDLDLLTQFYNELREAEQADDKMSIVEIKSQMQLFMQDYAFCVYLLSTNIEILGYAVVDTNRTPKYLRHLFIRRDYQNNGYGKHLIQLILERLGISTIDIEVFVWNKDAIKFYEKLGFKKRCYQMRLYSKT